MATLTPRQPFAVLDESRLQTLTSIKNRQNNIFAANASLKPTPSSAPIKRRLASDLLADEFDSENVDPSVQELPSKRSKGLEGTPTKVSKFTLITTPKTEPTTSTFKFNSSPSLSIPPPSTSTPISHSRGSPKNRRIAQLSNKRLSRSGGTPSFKRINPPTKSTTSLPFSLDAALQGTISSYTPAQPSTLSSVTTTSLTPPKKSKKSQPQSWFFEIHEDSEDQEATNLLFHNASTLDISSDDDVSSLRAKQAAERGKENVPPMGYDGPMTRAQRARLNGEGNMDVERRALGEMDVKSFWPEGKEELVIVDEKEGHEENIVPSVSVKKDVEVVVCVDSI